MLAALRRCRCVRPLSLALAVAVLSPAALFAQPAVKTAPAADPAAKAMAGTRSSPIVNEELRPFFQSNTVPWKSPAATARRCRQAVSFDAASSSFPWQDGTRAAVLRAR